MKDKSRFAAALGVGILLCAILFVYTFAISPLTSAPAPPPSRSDLFLSLKEVMSGALEAFRRDVRRYPSSEEGLAALVEGSDLPGWKGPYLPWTVIPFDPWGRPLQYAEASGTYQLGSLGPVVKRVGAGTDTEETLFQSRVGEAGRGFLEVFP